MVSTKIWSIMDAKVDDVAPKRLKGRQLDCMLLVKDGLSSKQIARELGISPRTVDQHIGAALENLGVSSRMAAIAEMYRLDQVEKLSKKERPAAANDDAVGIAEPEVESPQEGLRSHAILPPLGGVRNSASRADRIGWMVRIAIFCIMLTSIAILAILGVLEMASYLRK